MIKLSNVRPLGMYLYPKSGGNVYFANVDTNGAYAGNWRKLCDGGDANTANTANTAGTLATTPTNVCLRNISFGTADPQVTDPSAEGYVSNGALYGQYE